MKTYLGWISLRDFGVLKSGTCPLCKSAKGFLRAPAGKGSENVVCRHCLAEFHVADEIGACLTSKRCPDERLRTEFGKKEAA